MSLRQRRSRRLKAATETRCVPQTTTWLARSRTTRGFLCARLFEKHAKVTRVHALRHRLTAVAAVAHVSIASNSLSV